NAMVVVLSRLPLHRYVLPLSVNTICATELAAFFSACEGLLTQATSTSHASDSPISCVRFCRYVCRSAPETSRCEICGTASTASLTSMPVGTKTSSVAFSPSSTGDQTTSADLSVSPATGPNTWRALDP